MDRRFLKGENMTESSYQNLQFFKQVLKTSLVKMNDRNFGNVGKSTDTRNF